MTSKKFTFVAIYLTFFVDYLSWAIVFPIFAPYFLDVNNAVFSADISSGSRTMVLGFFITAFSLGQFLGAPIIGEYADKHGRKKALAISVFFTLIGLSLSAYSMQINNLYWLFAGRLITGVFASSTAVCLSCISDLSEDDKAKGKNFGYLSMIAGLAFVLGAFLGGKLSDKTINSSFSANVPLWIASGLTLLNLIFVLFGFRETAIVSPTVQFHFLDSFKNIKIALKTDKIKRIYSVYFLFLFAWTILFQFIPVLTVEKFAYTNSNIGDLALFMGVCWAIGSGYLNKFFVHRFDPMRVLEFCLIGFAVFCGVVIFPKHIYNVLGIVGFCVVVGGIAWPICTSLISNMAPKEIQGKILGLSQSVQSLAMSLGPAVGGIAFQSSLQLPFLIAAGTSLVAVVIYYFILKHR
jgi:MFS transporter, DHA1 family, tetracycline resistance protein